MRKTVLLSGALTLALGTTTAVLPAWSLAVLVTAPKPVITPQARSEALSKGTSLGIAMA